MQRTIERAKWSEYFQTFSEKNNHRSTRLEIFDENGVQEAEQGMPFGGIDLDTKDESAPSIEIWLEGEGLDSRHMEHRIPLVRQVMVKFGVDGIDEVLDIESDETTRTLLHFEKREKIGV